MNLKTFIDEQIEFSSRTFGPGQRLEGVTKHIEKEVAEVRATKGEDVSEWADIIILALDGAWRSGFTPAEIAAALTAKMEENKQRSWPDWRTAGPGPIEHIKPGAAA